MQHHTANDGHVANERQKRNNGPLQRAGEQRRRRTQCKRNQTKHQKRDHHHINTNGNVGAFLKLHKLQFLHLVRQNLFAHRNRNHPQQNHKLVHKHNNPHGREGAAECAVRGGHFAKRRNLTIVGHLFLHSHVRVHLKRSGASRNNHQQHINHGKHGQSQEQMLLRNWASLEQQTVLNQHHHFPHSQCVRDKKDGKANRPNGVRSIALKRSQRVAAHHQQAAEHHHNTAEHRHRHELPLQSFKHGLGAPYIHDSPHNQRQQHRQRKQQNQYNTAKIASRRMVHFKRGHRQRLARTKIVAQIQILALFRLDHFLVRKRDKFRASLHQQLRRNHTQQNLIRQQHRSRIAH
mmetsp:Transcript_15111/g.22873  ORF Transcript_15111/g.22873 Transcript_15111/m.22873 type:complete len:348 (-) Transcript_15111:2119-3162(-)